MTVVRWLGVKFKMATSLKDTMKSLFVLCFTYRERKCSIQICSSKIQNSGSSRSISLASEGTCVSKFTEVFLSHKWRQGRTGIWAGTGTVAAWKVIIFAHSGCKCPNVWLFISFFLSNSFKLSIHTRYCVQPPDKCPPIPPSPEKVLNNP